MRVDAAKVFPDNTLSLPKVLIDIILVTGWSPSGSLSSLDNPSAALQLYSWCPRCPGWALSLVSIIASG